VDGTFGDFYISEEELKKGIEENVADGYEAEVQDEDLADYYMTL